MLKEAIVLAGGLGTRLQGVITDIPKPMAPINNEPFLTYIFNYLKKFNIEKVVLAVGYKYEIIEKFYGNNYQGITIEYAIENCEDSCVFDSVTCEIWRNIGIGGGVLVSVIYMY